VTPSRGASASVRVVVSHPALYAHRLGREAGSDNSRAALRASLAAGVDGLETDVCLTADGRLALLHDPWLGTCTTTSGWARQRPWRELRAARLRDRSGAPGAETPMLLEELLDAAPPGVLVQVEVKAYGDPALARATARAVASVVRDRPDRERVEVLSFQVAACEEAVRQGLPARLVVWADYAPDALARWARNAGVGGVCIEHFLLHAELVERLRVRGLSVSTGTVNEAELAMRAGALGVDAITTDRPAALRSELAAQATAA
jgi:glycerophosphoryl diester phosphodiesterase